MNLDGSLPRLSGVPRGIPDLAGGRIVHCPDCGLAFCITERGRDKTTICPRCKYFLGCV
jgi:uncharacterized paraquat-inducible protein A